MRFILSWMRQLGQLSLANVLVVGLLIGVFALLGTDPQIITLTMIHVIVVVGLYCFVGQSGVFSFGHIAFMAIGAYTTAVLTIAVESKQLLFTEMPSWLASVHMTVTPALLVGALVAGGIAFLIGSILMRLSGLAASLGTFALLIIVHVVVQNLRQVTNGQSGMPSVPKTLTVSETFLWVTVCIVVVAALTTLPIALRLRAAREDEVAARSIGVRIYRERLVFWTASASLCGIAGGLHARYTGSVSPGSYYLDLTFLTVAMLVVGGSLSLSGAVVGAATLGLLAEILRQLSSGGEYLGITTPELPGLAPLVLALLMLVILISRPSGLTGGRELSLSWPARALTRLRGADEAPQFADQQHPYERNE